MSKVIEDMWKQAVKEGVEKGIYEANKANALRMLTDKNLSLEKIAEYSGLTLEEVKQLQTEKSA